MLVIRRRAGDSFLIGDSIEIEVLEVGATQVKLGIRAPKEVPVVRKEVSLTWQANRAASQEFDANAIGALLRKGVERITTLNQPSISQDFTPVLPTSK